jgi:Leucine-rich repeat (LRR) protein
MLNLERVYFLKKRVKKGRKLIKMPKFANYSFGKTNITELKQTYIVKKIHLLLSLIFVANSLFAQTILDLNFAKAIRSQCVDCLNDRNQLQPPARKIAHLNVNYKGISDLSGIEGFASLISLDCSNNKLTELPYLPNPYLKQIRCANNQLTSLPLFPESLLTLDCSGNKIRFITGFPKALMELTLNSNPIRRLPALPIHLQKLSCVNDSLIALPALPDDITYMDCSNNMLLKLPKLPAQLSKMIFDHNRLFFLPQLPYLLSECSVVGNHLTILPNMPEYLQVLDASNNQLDSLPTLPPRLSVLRFSDNKVTQIFSFPASLLEMDCRRNLLVDFPKLPRRLAILKMKGNSIPCLGNMPEKLTQIDEEGMSECMRPHFGLVEKTVEANAKKTAFQSAMVTAKEEQLVPYRKGNRWGYSNAKGEIMIAPQYDSATLFDKNPRFSYSFSIVSTGGLKGVIDVEGEYIVRPDYQKVYALTRGGFIGKKSTNENWTFISEDAIVEEKFPVEATKDPVFKRYAEGKAIVSKNLGAFVFNEFMIPQFIKNDSAQVGYLLKKKTIVDKVAGTLKYETLDSIPPQYSELKFLTPISFDTILAKNKEGKWGIISGKNDTIVPFIHDEIKTEIMTVMGKDSVKTCYFTGKKGGKWGVSSLKDGGLVLDYDFDEVEIMWLKPLNIVDGDSNRLFLKVRKADKWGLMGERLWQWVVPTEFDDVRLDIDTENGFQLIQGKQMGYYIIPAEKTIAPVYREVKYFKYGFAEVVTAQNKTGFINENGDEYFLE